MLKITIITLLLAIAPQCFAGQMSQFDNEIKFHSQNLALGYVNRGNEHLLSGKYFPALNDFQSASSLLANFEDCKPDLSFLICFGKTVAYDSLGMHEQCQSAMISLLLLMENPHDICALESINIDILRELASQAPSVGIQRVLMYLCDTIPSST